MRTITQLREDAKCLLEELGNMKALCINENRDPSKDERDAANAKLREYDEIQEVIKTQREIQQRLDNAKEPDEPPDKTPIDTRKDKKEQEKRDNFASNGEFFQAVMRAGTPGGPVDPRLSTRAAYGLSESVPSDGGFLVEPEMAGGILKNVWDTSNFKRQ